MHARPGAGLPGGGLEREVLSLLAAAGEAMTAGQVRAALGRDLAYTTVMTTLARLHGKGAVTREPHGRAYAYRWAADPAALTARQMRRLLDDGQDRAAVLARFVAELAPGDERVLAGLLADAGAESPS